MKNKLLAYIVPILIGVLIWIIPTPIGLKENTWNLVAVFVGTIVAFITAPLPMGAISLISIVIVSLLGILPIGQALSGFANTTIWLIVSAFLLSRGFVKTGLGKRIAYILIKMFGKNPISLAYTLLVSDLILAPATPSNTARAGGVIFPITKSLSAAFKSEAHDGTAKKIGSFLMQVIYQGNTVTSAMFMTSMAGNTLLVTLVAQSYGIQLSWGEWALASLVPGVISLLIIPLVLHKIYPPEIRSTREAQRIAGDELRKMGSLTIGEKIMLTVFIGCLILWATSTLTDINATTVALLGVIVLLITDVIDWSDVKTESGAWDTLVWMGTLISLATFLNKLGFIPWLAKVAGNSLVGVSWLVAFFILFIVYFYIHYAFASLAAHIAALYIAMTSVVIGTGAPVMLTLLAFAFASNLCMSLTHFAAGPSPIVFGAGYVSQSDWWKLGFIFSLIYIVIWVGGGSIWWKLLGLW